MKIRNIAGICITLIGFVSLACGSASLPFLATATPSATKTATQTATLKPTKTPLPTSTRTPKPTKTVIEGFGGPEGWKALFADDVLLYVPDTYIGGKTPNADYGLDEVVVSMNEMLNLVTDDNQKIDMELKLWGVDLSNSDIYTMVLVMGCDNTSSDLDMAAYGNDLGNLMSFVENWSVEDELITMDHYQAYQIVVDAPSEPMVSLFYLLESEDSFWLIMYTTSSEDPTTQKADFEQSINSVYFIE